MSDEKSYDFDQFSAERSKFELERLRIQAMTIAAIEIPRLLSLGLGSAGSILDLGCGPGFISAEIAKSCPDSVVTGLDSSEDLLDVAKTVAQPGIENIDFVKGDALATGFENNRFDFIYNRLIYQHLEEPVKALEEAKRITRPGGTVCVVDIDDRLLLTHPELEGLDQLKQLTRQAKEQSTGDRHIGVKLPDYMNQAGLKNIKIRMECISTLDIGWDAFHQVSIKFHYRYASTDSDKQLVDVIEHQLAGMDDQPFGMAGIIISTGVV
jgi:ubiquinone/menaquinone biosynthesis C-methylase UbiE